MRTGPIAPSLEPVVMRAVDLHVIGVEEDDEHARPGILRDLPALLHGARFDARVLRAGRPHVHMLERGDLLRNVVLEDLDLLGAQVLNRLTVRGRVHIHPDIVGFGAKRRSRLVGVRLRSRLCRDGRGGYGDEQGNGQSSSHMPGRGRLACGLYSGAGS